MSYKSISILWIIVLSLQLHARVQIAMVDGDYNKNFRFNNLAVGVSSTTSITLEKNPITTTIENQKPIKHPWLWAHKLAKLKNPKGVFKKSISSWIKKGGFLVLSGLEAMNLNVNTLTSDFVIKPNSKDGWKNIPQDHEMNRSFFLMNTLPSCHNRPWRGFHYDRRLAILVVPDDMLSILSDQSLVQKCKSKLSKFSYEKAFTNILMVALTTSYKNDQIHLPNILNRLR